MVGERAAFCVDGHFSATTARAAQCRTCHTVKPAAQESFTAKLYQEFCTIRLYLTASIRRDGGGWLLRAPRRPRRSDRRVCTQAPERKFSLTESRYDKQTVAGTARSAARGAGAGAGAPCGPLAPVRDERAGRFRHFWDYSHPKSLLQTESTRTEAKQLLEQFKFAPPRAVGVGSAR
jgi:hypothetical protein